jgi:hypothetical protein
MIWPDERTLFDKVASKISVPTPKTILQRSPQDDIYQKDVDRRDRLFELIETSTEVQKPKKDIYPHARERQYGH